jgi:hypothetical protein
MIPCSIGKIHANKNKRHGCNPHDQIVEGEDISVGQILSVAEKGLAVMEEKSA